MKLYQVVAQELGGMIRGGTLRSGDQLPSVRALCNTRRVSPSTVLRAYEVLESESLIEARSRSGYYVSERRVPAPEPRTSMPKSSSTRIAVSDLVFDTLEASRDRYMSYATSGGVWTKIRPTFSPKLRSKCSNVAR